VEFESTWFSMLKSIGWTCSAFILYWLVKALFSENTADFNVDQIVAAFALTLVVAVFLLFCWVTIGLPIHWFVCKFTPGGYFYYILTVIIFWGVVRIFYHHPEIIYFCLPISAFNMSIFKFYLLKYET
jgi:hypothetical protein